MMWLLESIANFTFLLGLAAGLIAGGFFASIYFDRLYGVNPQTKRTRATASKPGGRAEARVLSHEYTCRR